MTLPVDRSERIDALRGLAVFGILLVNIWSFVWGFEPLRYGILQPDATLADMLSIAFVAFFAEQKFYPVFAFLFGASFVLITQSIKRKTGKWSDAKRLYRRRLRWLLGCGVLHGTLVWFGDILTLYSIAGFWVLAGLAGARLRTLTASLRNWTIVFVVLLASGFLLNVLLLNAGSMATQAEAATASVQRANFIYIYGSLSGIAWQRLNDYLAVTMQSVFILPHVAVLFLLGALSVRRRWLTQPWRHRAFWRRTQLIGFAIGVPFNLLWATLKLTEAIDPLNPSMLDYALYSLLAVGGSCLAAAYVATLMLAGDNVMRPLQAWLAPVGRMALTHYLTQSLVCAVLLQGFGFGLGATLSPSGLMALAFGIMLLQALWSRWWLARHEQGPLEILSRRMINRD